MTRLPVVPEHVHAPLAYSLDRDRALGAVLGADAGLFGERALDVLRERPRVPEVVGTEHVGRERVATTVPDAEIGIDAHLHGRGAYALRGSHGRAASLRT